MRSINAIILPAVALIMCAILLPASCGSQQFSYQDKRVFEGKVADVDVSGSVLTVASGELRIAFPIASDTKLVKDVYNIRLSDIETGDYVTVEYYRSGYESRAPLKVTMVTLDYDASEKWGAHE